MDVAQVRGRLVDDHRADQALVEVRHAFTGGVVAQVREEAGRPGPFSAAPLTIGRSPRRRHVVRVRLSRILGIWRIGSIEIKWIRRCDHETIGVSQRGKDFGCGFGILGARDGDRSNIQIMMVLDEVLLEVSVPSTVSKTVASGSFDAGRRVTWTPQCSHSSLVTSVLVAPSLRR